MLSTTHVVEFFGWLHGAVAISSLWALSIWSYLLATRPFADDFRGFHYDTQFWICFGNVTGCLGTFGLSAMRAIDIVLMAGGAPHYADLLLGVMCLSFLLISRGAMVYASSLNHRPARWWMFLATLALWTILVVAMPGPTGMEA